MTTAANVSKATDVSTIVDRIVRPLTRIFNPLIMRVAGGRWFPMWSLLRHRGHRSGRMYTTPVSVVPRGEYFWLGLAFGQEAGWVRNVLAAGECVVRYRATDYRLVEPLVVDGSAARSELPAYMRVFMSMAGIHKILRMRPILES